MNSQHNTPAAIDIEWTGDCCETFTTDHGLTTSPNDAVAFAFVCPKCETPNAVTGDPPEFRNRLFRCMRCTHATRLDAAALDHFIAEAYNDV